MTTHHLSRVPVQPANLTQWLAVGVFAVALPGCLFIGADDIDAQADQDGDGFAAATLGGADCDDTDPAVHPGAEDVPYDDLDSDCDGDDDFDADGDGLRAAEFGGEDCDDTRASVGDDPVPWQPDCDGDGAPAPEVVEACGEPQVTCADGTPPAQWLVANDARPTDCDDGDASVHPGRSDEPYDGVDSNCDGADDFDADGDGFGVDEDCDDTVATTFPGAPDAWYDGVDGDCDGADDYDADADGYRLEDDCDDHDPTVFPGADDPPYDGLDADCAGDDDFDADGDGVPLFGPTPDCDDTVATTFPGADDPPYDGVDSDCDGRNDFDADGDGFVALAHPGQEGGSAPLGGDCDDGDDQVHPGADDLWYDGLDADCAGNDDFDQDGDGVASPADCADTDPLAHPGADDAWYDGVDSDCAGNDDFDQDGDGSPLPLDCLDTDASVQPGADEVPYDGIDADCDGANDYDADGDGFVAAGFEAFVGGTATGGGDCDDVTPTIYPGQVEVWYDGVDADCDGRNDYDQDRDGVVASGFGPFAGGTAPATDDCVDTDPNVSPLLEEVGYDGIDRNCTEDDEYDLDLDGARVEVDCDDRDPTRAPGLPEIWYDGIDSDCAGDDDFDQDGDGYTVEPSAAVQDCDDTDPSAHPDGVEVWYDGVDGDCDGRNDYDADGDGYVPDAWAAGAGGLLVGDCADFDPSRHPGQAEVFYDGLDTDCDGANDYDADGDGVVAIGYAGEVGGTALAARDCDDADPTVSPQQPEVWYDGIDADCDGASDYDRDGDGVVAVGHEAQAGGTAPLTGDCDDGLASVSPMASEVWYDGVDADCDGANDFDQDGDGYVLVGQAAQAGGTALLTDDCDDLDPLTHPDAADTSGEDRDCDGVAAPIDADGDGVAAADDCDDLDPSVFKGGAVEPLVEVTPGDPLADWVEAACDGTVFVVDGTHTVDRRIAVTRPLTLSGTGTIEAAGVHGVLDLAAAATVEGLALEGGTAVDGGCLVVSTTEPVTLTDLVFADCIATGRGGGLFLDAGAQVTASGLLFDQNTADEGGALATVEPSASTSLSELVSVGNAARLGGMLHASGGALTVHDSRFVADEASEDGGALHVTSTSLSVSGVTIIDASTGAGAGGLFLDDTTGTLDDVELLGVTGDFVFGVDSSVAHITGGTGTLSLDHWLVQGTSAGRALDLVDVTGTVTVHDLELSFHEGFYGIFAETPSFLDSTLTFDNVWVHHMEGGVYTCQGVHLYPIFSSGDWALRNATISDTTCERGTWLVPWYTDDDMVVRNVVTGSSVQFGQAAGVAWSDPAGRLDISHTYSVHSQPWLDAFTYTSGLPSGCSTCTIEAGSPFAAAAPSYAVPIADSSPLKGAGDPALCVGSSEPDCMDPGFWGGPNPPQPR